MSSKPFDAVAKQLVEMQPGDWLELLGLPRAPVRLIDADLSTVSAAADKVMVVEGETDYIVQPDIQASYDPGLPNRQLLYSVLARHRTGKAVHSAAILLRPEADGPAMSGTLECTLPGGAAYLRFTYQVVRVWQLPSEELLRGGLGTLPLAPIADLRGADPRSVVDRVAERYRAEVSSAGAEDFWAATYILMGLRYPRGVVRKLLRGVSQMRESSTYQAILEEGREEGRVQGRAEEVRSLLLRTWRRRFGEPSDRVRATVAGMSDIEQLEALFERALDVESWEELLGL